MLLCPQSVMKLSSDSECAPDEARLYTATGGVNILPSLHRLGDTQGARTWNRICENDVNDRVDRAAAFHQARELRWGIRGYLESAEGLMDIVSPDKRSQMMAGIKGKNTRPEMLVRRLVHGMGFRYRLHRKDLPGSPDLVFPRLRKVIFVHGCFWHRHPGCKFAYTPKSNKQFWLQKLESNTRRDARALKALDALGWDILVVWECEVSDLPSLSQKLAAFLASDLL